MHNPYNCHESFIFQLQNINHENQRFKLVKKKEYMLRVTLFNTIAKLSVVKE